MPRFELPKSIEARKLNMRSGLPVDPHWVTIPFGALLDIVETRGDLTKFTYLGELFHSADDVLRSVPVARSGEATPPAEVAAGAGSTAERPAAPGLRWERLVSSAAHSISRAKVPGGWLVLAGDSALTFYPDPDHRWDGRSLA